MEPCQNNKEWKQGRDFIDQYGNKRYWFDCGTFYFDGTYNVVKFPKDLNMYHGSPILAYYNAAYPIGKAYYDQSHRLTGKEKMELRTKGISKNRVNTILNRSQPIATSWYGDLDNAIEYSKKIQDDISCGPNCIAAYKLKKDAVFIDLSDPFNLLVLLQSTIPHDIKMFLATTQILGYRSDTAVQDALCVLENNREAVDEKVKACNIAGAFHPLKMIGGEVQRITPRQAIQGQDIYYGPDFLVNYFNKQGYAGYINPRSAYIKNKKPTGKFRFSEFVMGKSVFQYIERDLKNKYDWQHTLRVPEPIKKLIDDMGKYHTTNIDYHSGDLLEHSLWVMLYADDAIMQRNTNLTLWADGLRSDDIRLVVNTAAFFHDIGKAGDGLVLYYDKKKHPEVGKEYLLGEREYRVVKGRKVLNLRKIITDMGLPKEYIFMIAAVAENHWTFGSILQHLKNDKELLSAAYSYFAIIYTNVVKMRGEFDLNGIWDWFGTLIKMIMLISACDVYGAQPYRYMKRLDDINGWQYNNKISDVFPYLTNRPQVHRGGPSFDKFGYNTMGLKLRNAIITISNRETLRLNEKQLYAFRDKYLI